MQDIDLIYTIYLILIAISAFLSLIYILQQKWELKKRRERYQQSSANSPRERSEIYHKEYNFEEEKESLLQAVNMNFEKEKTEGFIVYVINLAAHPILKPELKIEMLKYASNLLIDAGKPIASSPLIEILATLYRDQSDAINLDLEKAKYYEDLAKKLKSGSFSSHIA